MYMYIGGIAVCTLVASVMYLASLYIACVWSVHMCVCVCVCVYKGGAGSTDKVFVCPLSRICVLCVCRILGLGRRKGSLASLWRQWIL